MAEKILASIGRADLVSDERFATNSARLANIDELDQMIGEFVLARTLAENLAHFEAAGVTAGPILTVDELSKDPHVRERQSLVSVDDMELGSVLMHNVCPRLSETPGRIRSASPALGEHQTLLNDYAPKKASANAR